MIFRAPLIRKILSGSKTQTRRPAKPGEECRYQVGHTYAVQPGRGQRQIARILVTSVHNERLGDLTPRAAQREGFKRVDQFFDYWLSLYGSVDHDQVVWAISFTLVIEQQVRLLHRDSSHGYTDKPTLALEGEPEAIDKPTMDRYAREGWAGFDARRGRREQAELQVVRERLAALTVEAGAVGVDLRDEMRVIGHRLESMERKLVRARAA